MRIYDYMKGILGAMGVGEDVGVPEPSWRIEEYLKAIYDKLKEGGARPTDEQVATAVTDWLDDHPEATTTVTDGSITNAKLASSFVTPGTAAAYSSSATYAVGDYVFHNGTLYRCTTAITTAEAWTAAHWMAAVLGDDVRDLKSALSPKEYIEGFPYIKELFVNSAGRTAGVTKLHNVYTSVDGNPSYYLRFSNGTSFTGHTEATATPDYGVIPIYSGMTGTAEVYGYVIINWGDITNTVIPTPLNIKEISYHLDFCPQISSNIVTEKEVNALEDATAYSDYDIVDSNFALVTTDYNLDDVTDSSNRFATSVAFFCKGKTIIEVDDAFVNTGFRVYVMSSQSGKLNQWAESLDISSSKIILSYNDTIRVSIFQANGISNYYNKIVETTKIYTLNDGVYFDYLKNAVIGAKKIWCFGDSLTAGVITGTTTITESYPYWLKKFLGNDSAAISNFGVPGDTAVNMYSVISGKTFYENCDIALIMIGTNGYMNGDADDPTTPLGAYYASIEHIINSGKGTVKIVLINPPKSIRNGVPVRWLDSMHYKEEAIAEHFNLDMIDLYAFLPFEPDNTTYYSSDKTHFTAIGYYWIAYIIYNHLINNMTAAQVGGNPTFDY